MDIREAFAQEIARISRRWRARLDERLRHTGLTQSRWNTLLQLSRGPEGMTQRELADFIGVEAPTVVRLLDALERQGLVERRPSEEDRRAYRIYLTEEAKALMEEINRIAFELRQEILADIPLDDLTFCLNVMRQIGERLEKR